MHACMYVCTVLNVCTVMNVWMYECMNVWMYVCMYACMYVCTIIYIWLYNYVYIYICWVELFLYIYICNIIYIYDSIWYCVREYLTDTKLNVRLGMLNRLEIAQIDHVICRNLVQMSKPGVEVGSSKHWKKSRQFAVALSENRLSG